MPAHSARPTTMGPQNRRIYSGQSLPHSVINTQNARLIVTELQD